MCLCQLSLQGVRKTLRLEKIRKQILNAYRGNTGEVYRKYAITDPTHGMHFGKLSMSVFMCLEERQITIECVHVCVCVAEQ